MNHNPLLAAMGFSYQHLVKPVLFQFDPEFVHEQMTSFGELLGKVSITKSLAGKLFDKEYHALAQQLCGITFKNPIGLSAGFDYEAKLPHILPALGFGFGTVGTITNHAYPGNAKPRLGRLPKSRALMVNKGFKNQGADAVITKLRNHHFKIPVGISIGRTNTSTMDQNESIEDIIEAFTKFEQSKVHNLYYELNISCPNLQGSVTFETPAMLEMLLKEVDNLHLARPVFLKMPISKSDEEIINLVKVVLNHQIGAVIIGNLQKNRQDPDLYQEEVKVFPRGNFSGKATWRRSNELIWLIHKTYHRNIPIIGCGGVFSAEDAFEKIIRGATLVQLITGMIYMGPQLIAEINAGIARILHQKGYSSISQAIGTYKV